MVSSFCIGANAQTCPPNLDFENGNFNGWRCYTGAAGHQNGANVITLSETGAEPDRHTIFTRSADTQLDPYGGFPVVCPNGSGNSIRLGNNMGGTQAEGVSYEFTIPANRNEYSLIYHYAVVFQDPSHQPYEQPRMEIEISNLTDNQTISCSSFTFYPVGSPLPGFFLSTDNSTSTPVWCKDWTAVTVNLDGNAGKRIRLFFKTADCTFRRHFGYAYIDVNSECTGEFTGANFCRGDSAVKVDAPYGYQRYQWFNSNFSQVLGTEQQLILRPAPQAGTTIAVEVTPYDGYGCPDTLFARLIDTLKVEALAGDDMRVCFGSPQEIGSPPKPGILYDWQPSAGLSDASIANPYADPMVPTNYVLTSRSYGGGCLLRDTVVVTPITLNNSIEVLGKQAYCIGNNDSTVLRLQGDGTIQWFRNETAITGESTQRFKVNQSGIYYAQLSKEGCVTRTEAKTVLIEEARRGIQYPPLYTLANTPVPLAARDFGTTYLWRPSFSLSTATAANTVFSSAEDVLYTVQINTAAGCITVDTQAVKIVSKIDIMVPTAFTPNNDGRNDVLRPVLFGMKELVFFQVYNRWGQLLFQSATPNKGWDGRIAGKIQGSEVVVWVAEAIGLDGKKYARKGTTVCLQ